MRREYASIAVMAALLVGSQAVAIALSPLFQGSGYQAFPNPSDVTNTVVYVILILVFTAVILGLVRYRRQNLAKYVIMASIFITLAFILLLPLYYGLYGLYYATGENPDPNFQNILANVATLLSFGFAALLVYVLVKFPEWYVVDTIGFVTAAGVTAILGISFGAIPAILLLVALAFYDAWAVYRTKHMITLADELTSQRLPILLVIPKKAGYSFREQKSLKGQIAAGEEPEAMFIGLGELIIPGLMGDPGSVGTTPMALWQGRSKRKPTGGRYRPFRKKRRREIGREQQYAFIGAQRLKLYRTKGANRKVRILSAEFANVLDRRTSVTKKVKIVTVKANPSNPNFVTRNIITRGATIQTEIGLARVTSRPGQDGVINAVLLETAEGEASVTRRTS